jgi:endonuclease/exonuclease/phosphatase family metal-dependent hydrolase
MAKRTLLYIIAIGLFLSGCVRIPDLHETAGHYNVSGDMNTECFTTNSIQPGNTPAAALQNGALNSRSFTVLNWNSHKGRNAIWQEDLERLSSRSDLVVLQEGYLTDDLQDLLNKKQYSWDIAKAFTHNDIYTGVLTASRIKPDFANIHMVNFTINLADYRAQLEKIAEVLSQHQGPLIISGDFNSWDTARRKILANITQELGVWEVAFDTDHRKTFMGQPLDHVFYRKLVPLEALTEKVTTSDHNPMLVTFRLADDV